MCVTAPGPDLQTTRWPDHRRRATAACLSRPRESGNVIRKGARIRFEDSTSLSRAPLSREVIGVFGITPGRIVAFTLVPFLAGPSWAGPPVSRDDDEAALRGKIDRLLREELTRTGIRRPWTESAAGSIRHSPATGRRAR